MSLHALMTVDEEFDTKPTEELIDGAVNLGVSERGRSLFALSKRVTSATIHLFVELLDLEQNREPMGFGSLPVRSGGIAALLLNAGDDIKTRAEELWLGTPFPERHDLKVSLAADGIDLPLHDHEQRLLDHALAVASERLGPGDWAVRPTSDGQAAIVRAPGGDPRALVVDADGSALAADSYPSLWDAELAFVGGARTATKGLD